MTNAHKTIQENHHHIVITTTTIIFLKGFTQDCMCWSASLTIISVKKQKGQIIKLPFPFCSQLVRNSHPFVSLRCYNILLNKVPCS